MVFVDGDGARPDDPLPLPPIVVTTRGRWDLYDGLAELSGWSPTIAVVTGRALDGHAGLALLCDMVVVPAGAPCRVSVAKAVAPRASPGGLETRAGRKGFRPGRPRSEERFEVPVLPSDDTRCR